MSRILCTGGAGFIGSHLVDRLIELGHKVKIIDNLSTGKIENINSDADFIQGDILGAIYQDFDDCDYVFHLAAIASVPKSIDRPKDCHEANVDGTFHLLNLARKVHIKKFIFASSAAIYGDQTTPYTEDMKPMPLSPYALHKVIGEQYCKLFNEVYGLPTICLRFFNVYGSRCDPNSDYSLVISKFKKLKEEGNPLTIYGDGEQTRDFVYVDDIVDGLIKAMESSIENEIINLCTGIPVSINKLSDLIGGEKRWLEKRKGDAVNTIGDNSKAKRLFDWKPKIPIEEGIKLF